ncbi:hypothetical protein QBC33DRAFT_448164 [Phialemonium atrogriseum]|uniref:CRIB domain-containing protein n=1 Tax=Phialemonium atrogriseum TaxID=1093897 RepID=A0AAJ0C2X4_9PEZI|nr:uncharacterized protein QBC33DRAFT_448164 [Phialemonium atrogriseum]KAK1769178.1 hypothetical protein QBC33DRAFT_448164 [Phialemonium atrogriseum]
MWALPPPTVYAVNHSARVIGGPKKSKSKSKSTAKSSKPTTNPLSPSQSAPAKSQLRTNITDLFEPAVDGPPSPESIRALNKQMRRSSVLDKHQSHQTTSSGSSSLRSLASGDRPSWENALEGISLSRKSSGRSTASSMPSRDRPESVQIFGKTLFNRRGKLRRESSAQSSSGSSLYSAEVANEAALPPTSAPSREPPTPGLFGRRRATRSESTDDSAAQRKLQISGPYNFQHVTHTQRNHLPDLRRTNRHTKSQEQIRVPPPRPPRSPVETEYPPAPPVPPPRISSRMSTRNDGFDPHASPDFERPQTSGGFRHPRPFGFSSPDTTSPPATSHGYFPRSNLDSLQEDYSPRVATPPDDSNWPLPNPSSFSYEAPLPGVPEEEENTIIARRSRASLASNASSLRGSQSVPLLRQLSLSQSPETKRPSSGASETLGRFDLFAAQRALKAALLEGNGSEPMSRESWEEDIDYCYDHEAEADCDYAWERPSLDTTREDESVTPVEGDAYNGCHCGASPSMLTPGRFDVPALSPASQVSMTTAQEALTPTVQATPKASNFSLPRTDISHTHTQRYLHVREPSDASSFKESHGFNLSPSLLIPNDYQQQMLASESDEPQDHHEALFRIPSEEPTLTMDTSTLLLHSRISASTTMSNDTDPLGSDRHVSTTSASTDFTRLTMSTSSLDMDTYIPKIETVEPPPFEESDYFHVRAKSQGTMPILPEMDDAPEQPMIRRDLTHGSDPNLVRLATEGDSRPGAKRKDQLLTRRRARTTSLSTPPPPGQYALFPSVHITGPRI